MLLFFFLRFPRIEDYDRKSSLIHSCKAVYWILFFKGIGIEMHILFKKWHDLWVNMPVPELSNYVTLAKLLKFAL